MMLRRMRLECDWDIGFLGGLRVEVVGTVIWGGIASYGDEHGGGDWLWGCVEGAGTGPLGIKAACCPVVKNHWYQGRFQAHGWLRGLVVG